MRGSRLAAVLDDGEEEFVAQRSAQEAAPKAQAAAIQMMAIALRALSQRALIALSNLFMLITGASVFILWYAAPPNPSIAQLVRLFLYATFVLALNLIKRRQ